MKQSPLTVAYFTMEIGLDARIPTYAGGLGVLAADLMRSCADMKVPAACMTVCWQHGYMKQSLRADGTQDYAQQSWNPKDFMTLQKERVKVQIEGRDVTVAAWRYDVQSGKHTVPVFFLDTNLPENSEADRAITRYLYGGEGNMRIKQEIVLGIGGVRMLRALGFDQGSVGTYHMNEGHAAFLTLELLRERNFSDVDVRKSCAFTTHTPVMAGHDVFDYDEAWKVVGDMLPWHIKKLAGEDRLSMTLLAMNLSRYVCGVSRVHSQVSRAMFPGHEVDAITNGVHHTTWVSPDIAKVLDAHLPEWRKDPTALVTAGRDLPSEELWEAHLFAKRKLLDEVNKIAAVPFDERTLTIASARRVVSYKRPELFYENLLRMKEVCCGRIQVIHAGNAHPADRFGQEVIQRMIERSATLRDCMRIVYLPNYNPDLARLLVSGADVWMNTPMRLHEASGTSGMKASLNGVINLSTLDGWWIEGYERDPGAGWRIGPLASALPDAEDTRKVDAEDLYTQLQYKVIPEYYYRRDKWISRMKRAISLLAYFNTHRCIEEYLRKAWNTKL